LAITPYIGILYMMSITLLLVVLRVRRIPVVFLNCYGYAGFRTADLKAVNVRVSRERIYGIRCWNESCTRNL
jgi:hypothetical protein